MACPVRLKTFRRDSLLTKVQDWVDAGRAERSAIEKSLAQLKENHYTPMKEASAPLPA